MKFRKLVTCLALVILSGLAICGCASIESIRVINPDYSIMDKLVITLDESKLNKAGKSLDEVRNSVKSDLETFRSRVYDWLGTFETMGYSNVGLILKDGISCEIPEQLKKNELSIVLNFGGVEYFRIFYGLKTVTEELQDAMSDENYSKAIEDVGPFVASMCNDDYKTEGMGLFLYKYYMFSDSGLLAKMEDFKLDENSQTYYEKYNTMTNYTLNDVEVSQIFAYPDDRIRSNADEVVVLDGMTLMQWDLSEKGADFEMDIYYVAAQTFSWYILGLLLSLLAVVVLYVVLKIKKDKSIEVKISKQEVEKNER